MKRVDLITCLMIGVFSLPGWSIASEKPDLAATDLRLDANCQIVVTIKNNGPGPLPEEAFSQPPKGSGVQMYCDNKPWGGTMLSGIDGLKLLKRSGGTVTHTWFPSAANLKLTPGAHTVRVDVDNSNTVKETNEQNNSLTRQLTCTPALPDLTPVDLTLDQNCQIVVTLKNIGTGTLTDVAYGHAPDGSALQMYNDNRGWGGVELIRIDPQKQLKQPGGTATGTWFAGTANLKLSPGTHTVKAEILRGALTESNTQNNSLTRQLTCQTRPNPVNNLQMKK